MVEGRPQEDSGSNEPAKKKKTYFVGTMAFEGNNTNLESKSSCKESLKFCLV